MFIFSLVYLYLHLYSTLFGDGMGRGWMDGSEAAAVTDWNLYVPVHAKRLVGFGRARPLISGYLHAEVLGRHSTTCGTIGCNTLTHTHTHTSCGISSYRRRDFLLTGIRPCEVVPGLVTLEGVYAGLQPMPRERGTLGHEIEVTRAGFFQAVCLFRMNIW